MARFKIPAFFVMIVLISLGSNSHGQIFLPATPAGENGTGFNSVDFNLQAIISCDQNPNGVDPDAAPLAVICAFFLEELVDQLVEAEQVLDEIFNGYRQDSPRFFRNQLDGPVVINVVFAAIDGPGGTLANAGPDSFAFFTSNPLLRFRDPATVRDWVLPTTATINLDIDDVIALVVTELMVDVAVHEAFHAMGHPSAFEFSNLNAPSSGFGQINFVGDEAGINGAGYGLTEFREESGNFLATFVPLSQSDGAGHLSAFEPTFNRVDEGFQEAFIPFAPPPGIQGIMSFSLQGMFADLGYLVRGINAPGIIDLDNDGEADDPVIINPILGDSGG